MFQKRIVVFLLLITMVAALPLWIGQSAQAQDDMGPAVFCGDLSEADCAILVGSSEAMATVYAASVDGEASFTLSGFEMDDGMDELTVMMTVTGAAEADIASLNAMMMGMPMDMEGMIEMLEDPDAILAMALEALTGVENLIDNSNADLSMEFSTAPVLDGGPESINVAVRMTDGVFYIQQQPLAEQLDLPGPVDAEWAAVDLGTAFDEAVAEMMSELDLSEITGMEINPEDFEGLDALMETDLINLFNDPAFLSEFTSVERLADAEVDGQTMAVFETTVDLRDMLLSPTLSQAVFDFLEVAQSLDPEASDDLGITPAEVQLVMSLVGSMLTEGEVTTVQWIGVDDMYVYHTEGEYNFTINLALLAGDDPDFPQTVSVFGDLAFDMNDFNQPVEVTVPDDVEFYDLDELE